MGWFSKFMGWFSKKEELDSSTESNNTFKSVDERDAIDAIIAKEQRELREKCGKGKKLSKEQREYYKQLYEIMNNSPSQWDRLCSTPVSGFISAYAKFLEEKDRIVEFIDSRDGKKYRTVRIGSQVWMAEDLKYDGQKYDGRRFDREDCRPESWWSAEHYDWLTAKYVCPSGWHLPTLQEWNILIDFVGGRNVAGKKLLAEGSDDYLFSAQKGSEFIKRKSAGRDDWRYSAMGEYITGIYGLGGWWTATEGIKDEEYGDNGQDFYLDYAYSININRQDDITERAKKKVLGLRVRCVRD